jgi:hypothetical protein
MQEKGGEDQLDRSFEKWKISHRVKEERNFLHHIKRMRPTWIAHMLGRNCLLRHVTEGKIRQKWREEEEEEEKEDVSRCWMTSRKGEDTGK